MSRNETIYGYVSTLRERLRAQMGLYFDDGAFREALTTALARKVATEIESVVSSWPASDLVSACEAAHEISALEASAEGESN